MEVLFILKLSDHVGYSSEDKMSSSWIILHKTDPIF